jgi:hypothetical protein
MMRSLFSTSSSRPERASRSGETPVFRSLQHQTQRELSSQRVPLRHAHRASRWVLTATLLLTPTLPLHAQGCAQCLDSTRATPPQVQSAYRHAIYLLAGTAGTLFLTGALLLRRNR